MAEVDDGAPDLTDFMNDWFFGTVGVKHNAVAAAGSGGGAYDLTGESSSISSSGKKKQQRAESDGGRSSSRSSNASKQTQDWLEEAKRMMVGSGSPGRMGSPSRQVPKFAGGNGTEPSPALDRRDPMSRSARRHRQPGGIGDEILQRASVISSPPRSETPTPSAPPSPSPSLPPNPHSSRRKSRFHGPSGLDSSASFRRTNSSASNSPPPASAPPRPPHHRRHASASPAVDGFDDGVARLNAFLRRQRAAVADLSSADRSSRSRPTKLLLSDASKSVSSIVAAICYAWMQSSKADGHASAAVPVVNMRRSRMAGCRQAAWLLYHVGVDASALLFADEVDMDGLMMDQRASLVVVGQDVLRSNGEVSSVCTVLANDNSEEAYSLLQSLDIKKLLLAGILLDTNNLSKMCSDKDSEAVRSLLLGSSEHKRHELFQQLMLDHNDHSFVEFLKNTYRKSSTDGAADSPPEQKHSASGASQDAKKSNSTNQRPTRGNGGKPSDEAPQGKNKFSLAKFFGFGRK